MLSRGSRAPDFELPVAGGGEQSLRNLLTAGPVLLAFYKVSCPTCQFTFPFLQRLSKNVPVVGVAQDDERSVSRFGQTYGITFPSLMDERSAGFAVSNAYKIRNVPSLFLVESNGEITVAVSGFSRADLAGIGKRFGVAVFRPEENVPEFRPG